MESEENTKDAANTESEVKLEETELLSLPENEEGIVVNELGFEDSKAEEQGEFIKVVENEEEQEEEAEEGEEEDSYREPIVDGRNITFKTRILNQYLLCSLCMGYFREANTIIECLHTFCKSCIYKYFRERSDCPHCGAALGTYPYDKLKFDRQIQTMVDKILPDIVTKDLDLEKEFYEKRGIKVDIIFPQGLKRQQEEQPEENVAKKIKKSELKKFYADEIGFELILDEKEADSRLRQLDKPFIRTSAKVTVKHLKKYLLKKLNVESSKLDLEITYRGEVLGTEHSLEYIAKTRGIDKSGRSPIFKYSLRKDDHILF